MHVPLGGDHVADLRPDGRIISPDWPGNALVYSQREWRKLRRIRKSGSLSWSCYPRDPIPDKRLKMDGWMDGWMDIDSIMCSTPTNATIANILVPSFAFLLPSWAKLRIFPRSRWAWPN